MTARLALPEKLDTGAAPGLQDLLLVNATEDLVLDGQGVKCLGALCAQIILACCLDRRRIGSAFSLEASEAMRADIHLLGLAPMLISEGDDT
jgi:anti-anti-sigma regulatory factor